MSPLRDDNPERPYPGVDHETFAEFWRLVTEAVKDPHPKGKIAPNDEGATVFLALIHNGRLILQFHKPMGWVGFDPEAARKLRAFLDVYLQEHGGH